MPSRGPARSRRPSTAAWTRARECDESGRLSPALVAGAVGMLLGMHAVRSLMAVLAWNFRPRHAEHLLGIVILAVCAGALFARAWSRAIGGARPEARLALLFGVLWTGAHAFRAPEADALLIPAAAMAWFAWLPAYVLALGRAGRMAELVPALLVGITADVALRTALHGLDSHALEGTMAVFGSASLSGLLALSAAMPLCSAVRVPGPEPVAAEREPPGMARWGPALLGPFLFLQGSLLANPSRVELIGGWHPLPAAALVLAGLLAGTAAVPRAWRPAILVGPLALGGLLLEGLPPGVRILLFVPAQAGAAAGLARALRLAPLSPSTVYRGWAAGAALFFALVTLYYAPPWFGWHPAWLIAALLLALPAVWVPRATGPTGPVGRCAAALALAGIALASIRLPAADPRPERAPERLKLLTYNVHHGFDSESVPAVQRLASFLESRDADLIALQEVGRGDLVHGGVDLLTYLRWRLPHYHVVYGPAHEDLAGNVILSRYRVRSSGHLQFNRRPAAVLRGLAWVTIDTAAGEALFVSTHMDGFRSRDGAVEAAELTAFWAGRPRTLIAGDFNSVPGARPLRILESASLVDLPAVLGIGGEPTFRWGNRSRRLDYLWASPDVEPVSARIPMVSLSDHLPVEVTVRLKGGD